MPTSIALTPVEGSSQVKAHGFDPATGTLAVQYKTGGIYHTTDFTAADYAALQAAPSLGKHLHAHVKGNPKYTTTHVNKPEKKG